MFSFFFSFFLDDFLLLSYFLVFFYKFSFQVPVNILYSVYLFKSQHNDEYIYYIYCNIHWRITVHIKSISCLHIQTRTASNTTYMYNRTYIQIFKPDEIFLNGFTHMHISIKHLGGCRLLLCLQMHGINIFYLLHICLMSIFISIYISISLPISI